MAEKQNEELYLAIAQGGAREVYDVVETYDMEERLKTDQVVFEYGFRPLSVAVVHNKMGVIDLLVRTYGAPVDTKDGHGITAYEYALCCEPVNEDIVYFLKERINSV